MKAKDFVSLVANLGRPGEPEEEAAALRRLIHMARKVQPEPQPDLGMLRTAIRLLDHEHGGMFDNAMTYGELLNARAAARANVAQFIIEADPMGPEAADQGLAREIAGTEVEGEKKSLEEYLYRGEKYSGQAETAQFCDLLEDMMFQMRGEGEPEGAIREHLLGMADEFIETAQAFKKYFGGAA